MGEVANNRWHSPEAFAGLPPRRALVRQSADGIVVSYVGKTRVIRRGVEVIYVFGALVVAELHGRLAIDVLSGDAISCAYHRLYKDGV
jgi:hypothetical protein